MVVKADAEEIVSLQLKNEPLPAERSIDDEA
jgi:hypothetical protein